MTRGLAIGIWAALAAAATLGACGGSQRTGGATGADAILRIQSNVRDAQLFVDGRFVAELGRLRGGVAMEPGAHRLEVRHEAYFSRYLEITVQPAERKAVRLDMAPILP